MNNFRQLYILSFKNYFAKNPNSKSGKYRVVQYAALGILMTLFVGGMCAGAYFLGSIMTGRAGLEYVVSNILMASQLIVLFQGVATTLSVLYFSKDNEFLRALPIRPHEIFLSKLAMIYTTNLALSTVILLPVLIVLGASAGAGFQYYLILPVALIFTPMIPLFIVAILSMPIMLLVRVFKRSSIASLIAMIVAYVGFMAVYFGLIFGLSGGADDGAVIDMESAMDSVLSTLRISSCVIYPNLFIARAMAGVSVGLNLPVYAVVMLAIGAIAIGLAFLFYGKLTAYGSQNVAVKHKARVRQKVLGTVSALIKNDLLNLSRQPGLMFNSIIGLIIVPFITAIFSMSSPSALTAMMFPLIGCGMNYFAMLAVSRERDKFFITKYLPVTPRQYVTSKLVISTVYVGALTLVVLICFLIMGFNIIETLICAFMVLAVGLLVSGLAITDELKHPNLTWTTLKELTNGGRKLYYVLAPLIIGMLFSIGGAFIEHSLGTTTTMIILLCVDIAVFGIALYFHYALLKNTDRLYNSINASNG